MHSWRDKQEMINAELGSGELLLWTSYPDPWQVARQTLIIFIFGLAWTWATISLAVFSRHHGTLLHPVGTDLFALHCLLVGLVFLLAPRWAYVSASQTVYGITSQRVLIIYGSRDGRVREVESYGKADMGTINRKERADGSGDLTFAQISDPDGDSRRETKEIRFVGIQKVSEVEHLLRTALVVE